MHCGNSDKGMDDNAFGYEDPASQSQNNNNEGGSGPQNRFREPFHYLRNSYLPFYHPSHHTPLPTPLHTHTA